MTVFPKAVLLACLATFALFCAGCDSRETPDVYRVVPAEPGRDTEAARQENNRGLEALDAGDMDDAAEAFGRALTADLEYGPAHNNLGKVYYLRRDWYKAAWEFEYAARLLPQHAQPHHNLGLVLEEAGELDRAVESHRQAVGLDPGEIAYRAALARALVRRGDRTDEVRALLSEILTQDTRPEWLIWAKRELVRLGESK